MAAELMPRTQALGLRALARLLVLNLRSVLVLPFGLLRYALTGRTGSTTYQSFVWLACSSGGRLNDALSAVLGRIRPKVSLAVSAGVLGELGAADLSAYTRQLRTDGFLLFPAAVPELLCARLLQFALSTPAAVRRMDHEPANLGKRNALFEAAAPQGVRYDYDTQVLLDNPDVQALLADCSLLSLAQEYLGCRPTADVLSMWWHTSFHAQPDSEAAQYFHFDMDRIKWLKVFVYLTDVGTDNGPHTFIRGTHRSGAIPGRFLQRGYARLTDEEVYVEYPPERRIEFCAPRGSVIIEDTRGLHKGASVRGAPRLVLQLQFSNSLFGTNYARVRLGTVRDPGLESLLRQAPAIYRQYL
jgi:Phytanoyl-CoA dioxygenase (PhyH)